MKNEKETEKAANVNYLYDQSLRCDLRNLGIDCESTHGEMLTASSRIRALASRFARRHVEQDEIFRRKSIPGTHHVLAESSVHADRRDKDLLPRL